MRDELARIALVSGKLAAAVMAHTVETREGPRRCWTYQSDGLARLGHPEVRFTLAQLSTERDGDYPEDGLHLLRAIWVQVERGARFQSGDVTEFDGDGLLGRAALRGVMYLPSSLAEETPDGPLCLDAMLLLEGEIETVRAFGPTRVAARLAHRTGHFPHPSWNERDRSSVVEHEPVTKASLWSVQRVLVQGASVTLQDDRLTLRLPREGREALVGALAELDANDPWCVLCPPTGDERAGLVWYPGQAEAIALASADGDVRAIAGAFLVVAPGESHDGGNVFEDGFAARLSTRASEALRAALTAETTLEVAPAGHGETLTFVLSWV